MFVQCTKKIRMAVFSLIVHIKQVKIIERFFVIYHFDAHHLKTDNHSTQINQQTTDLSS